MKLFPRIFVIVFLCWGFLASSWGHGNPSVAALISRDPGEALVAKLNLDLAVFFKGRVEPNQAWVEQQSPGDLELLKGDLDKFLRELYEFSVPGTYSFPLLGVGGERQLAPGITLPDGHVMPVFTSDEPSEDVVWVSASDEAAPLVIVKEFNGERSRRSVILFPGEEREVFPALVLAEDEPVVVEESALDASLFSVEEQFIQRAPREDFLMGWDSLLTTESLRIALILLTCACLAVSPATFWSGAGAAFIGILVITHTSQTIPARNWIPVTAILAIAMNFTPRFKRGTIAYSILCGLVVGLLLSTGLLRSEGANVLITLGFFARFIVIALFVQLIFGLLWRKQNASRPLLTLGVYGVAAVAAAIAVWLLPV